MKLMCSQRMQAYCFSDLLALHRFTAVNGSPAPHTVADTNTGKWHMRFERLSNRLGHVGQRLMTVSSEQDKGTLSKKQLSGIYDILKGLAGEMPVAAYVAKQRRL